MRNKRITRIVCLLMAALLLVSSVVIAVSADGSGNKSKSSSMNDFLAKLDTISYEEYMEYYADLFEGGNGNASKTLAFDATTGWTFNGSNGEKIEITANGWKLTEADGETTYDSVDAAVEAGYAKNELVYLTDEYDETPALYTPADGTVTWNLDLGAYGIADGSAGLYSIEVVYYPVLGKSAGIEREFYLNGETPFSEARALNFPKLWGSFAADGETALNVRYVLTAEDSLESLLAEADGAGVRYRVADDSKSVYFFCPDVNTKKSNEFVDKYDLRFFTTDTNRNELRPSMEQAPAWTTYVFRDSDGYYANSLGFVIEPENNVVSFALKGVNEPMAVTEIRLVPYAEVWSYDEYIKDIKDKVGNGEGTGYVKLESEYTSTTSTNVVYPIEDRTSPLSSPVDTHRTMLNTIGTEKWVTAGQWVEYRFSVDSSGLYNIYTRFKQSYLDGMYVSRSLQIYTDMDIETYKSTYGTTAGYYNGLPFAEAAELRYNFGNNWQVSGLNNGGDDMQIYFREGVKYTLRFDVTLGSMSSQVRKIEEILNSLNNDYLSILKLTGTTPDDYRDYNFNRLLPDTIDDMRNQAYALEALSSFLKETAGVASTYTGVCDKLEDILRDMVKDEDSIAKNLENFKSYVGSLGTFLTDAKTQPLQIDYICIQNSDAAVPKAAGNFFQTFWHECQCFFQSFVRDYNSMGSMSDAETDTTIEVWVPYGRDQANVLRNLTANQFTPSTGIAVDLKLITAGTLLPSILAGMGPDAYMGLGQDTVINYAIRGALANIETMEFDTVEEFEEAMEKEFNAAAMQVMGIADSDGDMHYYGLPETQDFPMMFVRQDILAELEIPIPTTWEEIYIAQSTLESNNMEIGVTTDYKIFLYQMGGELFADDGMRINLDSIVGLAAFEKMCNMFTQYSFPYSYNAANRFRTGEMPIIISSYTALYNQLKVFATELDGVWTFVPLPGIVQEDGSVNNASISACSAVVMIAGIQETEASYKFMRWQTGANCQEEYANEMVAIIGDSAKHSTANRTALESMPWTRAEFTEVKKQFENLASIPNYPGTYIIGRYTGFAFLSAYNDNADPTTELLSYINTINTEITRKREEFKLETLADGQKLSQKRLDQATKAVLLLEENFNGNGKYTALIKEVKLSIANAEKRIGKLNDTAALLDEVLEADWSGNTKTITKVSGLTVEVRDYYVNVTKQTAEPKNGGYEIDSLTEQQLVFFLSECLKGAAKALASY
ncbi:MAG: extracellular solute-binding protein [Clostridia bacterium]|nr:extracellular solute-binding protein [Clostridia bacterium]